MLSIVPAVSGRTTSYDAILCFCENWEIQSAAGRLKLGNTASSRAPYENSELDDDLVAAALVG